MFNKISFILAVSFYVSVTSYCYALPTEEKIGDLTYVNENDAWYVQGPGCKDKVLGEYIIVKYKNATKSDEIDAFHSINNLSIKKELSNGWFSLYIPKDSDPIEMIKKCSDSGIFEYTYPNVQVTLTTTPNDTYFSNQGFLHYSSNANDIDAPEA